MRIHDTIGAALEMRVSDLQGAEAVMAIDLETNGHKRIAAGARVKVTGHARFVRIEAPTCASCGVSFGCRIPASDADRYLRLLPKPETSPVADAKSQRKPRSSR